MVTWMKHNFFAEYPVVSALLLAASIAILMLCGYFYVDGVPDTSAFLHTLHLRMVGAIGLWILGCGCTARTRHAPWRMGFLCSLFFLPGLLLLLWMTGKKDRHQVWQEANPQLVDKPIRRHYRNVKALY